MEDPIQKEGLARARDIALRIIDDSEYQARLRERAVAGTLDPSIEEMLLYYAFSEAPPQRTARLHVLNGGKEDEEECSP